MASSSIGSGALILSVDSAKLSSGLAQSKQQITGFGDSFKMLSAVGAGAAAFSGIVSGAHTAVSEIEKSFERAHETVKGAAEFGLTTNTYGVLAASARVAGLDVEKFNKGLLKLQEKLDELRGNAPEAATQIFASLGLSAKQMDVDVNKATELLAGAFQKTGNRQALFELVGPKSFADFAMYLGQGQEGLQKLKEKLSGVGDGAAAIEKAAENMRLLNEQINKGVDLIVTLLVPAMNKIGEDIQKQEGWTQWVAGGIAATIPGSQGLMAMMAQPGRKDTAEEQAKAAKELADKLNMTDVSLFNKQFDEAEKTLKRFGMTAEQVGVDKLSHLTGAQRAEDMVKVDAQSLALINVKLDESMKNLGKTADELAIGQLTHLSDATKKLTLDKAELDRTMKLAFPLMDDKNEPLKKFADELKGLKGVLNDSKKDLSDWDKYYKGIGRAGNSLISSAGLGEQKAPEVQYEGSAAAVTSMLTSQMQLSPLEAMKAAILAEKAILEAIRDNGKITADALSALGFDQQ